MSAIAEGAIGVSSPRLLRYIWAMFRMRAEASDAKQRRAKHRTRHLPLAR